MAYSWEWGRGLTGATTTDGAAIDFTVLEEDTTTRMAILHRTSRHRRITVDIRLTTAAGPRAAAIHPIMAAVNRRTAAAVEANHPTMVVAAVAADRRTAVAAVEANRPAMVVAAGANPRAAVVAVEVGNRRAAAAVDS